MSRTPSFDRSAVAFESGRRPSLSARVQRDMPHPAGASGGSSELPKTLNLNSDIFGPDKSSQQANQKQILGTDPSKISFTTPAQDATSGKQPDYYLNSAGKLVKNPKATASKDGSLSIEVEGNNSAKKAEQYANKVQKQAISSLVADYKRAHPGEKVPEMWQSILDSTPDSSYPNTGDSQNNNTVTPEEEQDYQNSQPDTPPTNTSTDTPPTTPTTTSQDSTPSTTGSDSGSGGGSSGGGSGGGGGGDYSGGGSSGGGSSGGGSSDLSNVAPGQSSDFGSGTQGQANQIMDWFTQHGISEAGAAAIVGNMITESGLNTGAFNKNEGALGLCQWEGGRLTALESFATQNGGKPTDLNIQEEFVMQELQQRGLLKDFQGDTTGSSNAVNLAHEFQAKFEVSADSSLPQREANAEKVYDSHYGSK